MMNKESVIANKYLRTLSGIEIGPSIHNSFGLTNKTVGMKLENFEQIDYNITGQMVVLDIIAQADSIPIPTESEDYVFSSHVLEHTPDLIKTLVEWYRVIKRGGYLFMIIPLRNAHKTDINLPVEDWRHHFNDYKVNATFEAKYDNNYSEFGHYHRFTLEVVYQFFSRIFGNRVSLVDFQEKDDKVGNGFTVVFRKEKSIKESFPWEIICDDERINNPKPPDFYQL